ncbi:ArsR family transcriptional regulator [Rhodobacter aestuarii]|uniref:Transcriptional regulator, ArsR family n=1 Tax=Rhodobacter aestuarii TaxID=453582 RepID=A0A1N7IXL2_9RHOB|nr:MULTISPECIES: metalloregulator ArsR/SmtB family transcription factor [Rhodobacter]PTV97423.1 ArsR family transcriptional regulator [Rhodobacter aestuarii]SIS41833.1 transcriptional regulator, ArsR family [Rhodobacter aestuarii]SOC00446.1 ArsR family transcriptional regulator [Rhodobacter sp. JA431]
MNVAEPRRQFEDEVPPPWPLPEGLDGLIGAAEPATNFLKALGHDGRLLILCHLLRGPRSVTELENLLAARQAVVSQQLARLRLEGLVSARREGQTIIYSLLDPKVAEMIGLLSKLYGVPAQDRAEG